MQFINPIWLFALPLVVLPIVIHLLNQRRHRTVEWGAMQFLLSAKRMSRGMARLRQILIMAARMLVIAALIFVISRPLSTGWVGSLTGGKPETIIVLLDRSASMQHQQIQTGETKLSTGLKKIVSALQTIRGDKPIVLIESNSNKPINIDRPKSLLDLPGTTATDSQADLAAMLETTLNYINDNQTGRTDVWICSDAAENDWNPASSRWQSLNSGYAKLDGVRVNILNFPEPVAENLSLVVDRFQRITTNDKPELVVDLTVQRVSADQSTISVPLTFNINGLRSVVNLDIDGETAALIGHRIPIDAEMKAGWGQIELPSDSNASDNSYFVAFADPAIRRTVIVSENSLTTRAIELAARTSIQDGIEFAAVQLKPEQVGEIDWQQTALVVWQAPLPSGTIARQITSFINDGRTVIFLPPKQPAATAFAGVSWGQWQQVVGPGQSIGFWNNDEDLLRKTRNGAALPVNDLLIYRHCLLEGDVRVLARLENGSPLLTRRTSNAGAIYFLTTLPVATHSSFDREGITLFALLHRAMEGGADSLGAAKQFDAGSLPAQIVEKMSLLAPQSESPVLAESRPFRAGIYGSQSQLVALNRPLAEDRSPTMARTTIDELFTGLDYQVIDDQLGSGQTLASEVWRFFIAIMGVALMAEALFSLPPKLPPKTEVISTANEQKRAA